MNEDDKPVVVKELADINAFWRRNSGAGNVQESTFEGAKEFVPIVEPETPIPEGVKLEPVKLEPVPGNLLRDERGDDEIKRITEDYMRKEREYKEEITSLRNSVDVLNANYHTLENNLNSAKRSISEKEEESRKYKERQGKLEEDLQRAGKKLGNSAADVNQLKEFAKTMNTQLLNYEDQMSKDRREIESLRDVLGKIKESEVEAKLLRIKLTESEQKYSELQSALKQHQLLSEDKGLKDKDAEVNHGLGDLVYEGTIGDDNVVYKEGMNGENVMDVRRGNVRYKYFGKPKRTPPNYSRVSLDKVEVKKRFGMKHTFSAEDIKDDTVKSAEAREWLGKCSEHYNYLRKEIRRIKRAEFSGESR